MSRAVKMLTVTLTALGCAHGVAAMQPRTLPVQGSVAPVAKSRSADLPQLGPALLRPDALQAYVQRFNSRDYSHGGQTIANEHAAQWMAENVPLFACPDRDIEEIYHFRWWTLRKHIKQTPDGFVITEFLPKVGWSGKYNTISCPAGHHFREARWIRNPRYLDDYAVFWFRRGGSPRTYSFWAAHALYQQSLVRGDFSRAIDLLPELIANYEAWEKSRLDPDGLFWQIDGQDGMEVSIAGHDLRGEGKRATINAYMYGDAQAIAALAERARQPGIAAVFRAKAKRIKRLVLERLWDRDAEFFKVLPRGEQAKRVDVRELHGFTPWYFHLPDPGQGYETAWRQLMDPQGFYAPFGPTTAEQRHPGFSVSYTGHECQWNGPSWPFATAMTLTALANVLHDYPQQSVSRQDYFDTLKIYTRSHRLQREDGTVVPWIDENLNPFTGDWIARTRLKTWKDGTWDAGKGGVERGKDYNHSTYCDLIITGLVGLRPQADDTVLVNPLLPAGTWDWFCLDQVPYHGRILTILYDKTGAKYNRGSGLRILADGQEIGACATLGRLTASLPAPTTSLPPAAEATHSRQAFPDPVVKDTEGRAEHADHQMSVGEGTEARARALTKPAKPLKVYILAGQSNMEGHARIETFDYIGEDPATAPLLRAMRAPNGQARVCDQVWISYLTGWETLGEGFGKLTAGYGARSTPTQDDGKIGPEFTFGITMERAHDGPILLIKTAWGGKSLNTDFRPPSAGPYELNAFQEKLYNGPQGHGVPKDLDQWKADKAEATGKYYRLMIDHVKGVLADPQRVCPAYDPQQGYEIAGFVWFQGWNDMCDGHTYPDNHQPGAYALYTELMAHFIRDVRRDLKAPHLPFVIGVIGVDGDRATGGIANLRPAMAAPAAMPEFRGNVAAVETAPFWDHAMAALQPKKALADHRLSVAHVITEDGVMEAPYADMPGWMPIGTPGPEQRIWRFISFDAQRDADVLAQDEKKRFRDVTLPAGLEQWTQPDFDDSLWHSGQAPIGKGTWTHPLIGAGTVQYNSAWGPGEFILMRTHFEVDNLDYEAFRISVLARQGFHVYLNGHRIHTYIWWKDEPQYRPIPLERDAIKYLRKSSNVLAVYANAEYDKRAQAWFATTDLVIEGITQAGLAYVNSEAYRDRQMHRVCTPAEAKIIRGCSNGGYHYLGSAKIMAQIGQAFAQAMLEMETP